MISMSEKTFKRIARYYFALGKNEVLGMTGGFGIRVNLFEADNEVKSLPPVPKIR